MKTFDSKIQHMPLEELQKLQFKLLKETVEDAYKNSIFYRKRFDNKDITPDKISSFSDFQNLPLMNKFDLLQNNPLDIMTCSLKDIAVVYSSGGTSGKSKLFPTDTQFLEIGEEMCARLGAMQGINNNSVVILLLPMGIACAGNYIMKGFQKLGAFTIPAGLGLDYQFIFELMQTFKCTHIVTTPATAVSLTKELKKSSKTINDFCVRGIITCSAPLSVTVRKFLENEWGAEVFDFMGACECILAAECSEHDGLHIFPDYFYMEVLDFDTKKPVNEGEVGELVITSFKNRGIPLIRYQMDDLVKFTNKSCRCGRTFPRIWMLGRTTDTIFLGGHKVFSFQIESVLSSIPEVSTNYQLKVYQENRTDVLSYKIETFKESDINNTVQEKVKKALENLSITHKQGIREGRFKVEVELVKIDSLERTPRGKIKNQIIDLRKEI